MYVCMYVCVQEMKSMLHVSETAVREARSAMQASLEALLDAEVGPLSD